MKTPDTQKREEKDRLQESLARMAAEAERDREELRRIMTQGGQLTSTNQPQQPDPVQTSPARPFTARSEKIIKGAKKIGDGALELVRKGTERVKDKFQRNPGPEFKIADVAQKIRTELENQQLTPEAKKQKALEMFLSEKAAFHKENGGDYLKRFDKWWEGQNKTVKTITSTVLTGGATIAIAATIGMIPTSLWGIGARLASKVGAATGLNMALSSEKTQKFLGSFKNAGGGIGEFLKKYKLDNVVTIKNAAMVGGLGLSLLLGGWTAAAIGAGGMVGKNLLSFWYAQRKKALEEKRANLSLGNITFNDNYDVNDFAKNINLIAEEHEKISRSLARVKWGKNILSGALSVGVGLGTMSASQHHAEAKAHDAEIETQHHQAALEANKPQAAPVTPEPVPVTPTAAPKTNTPLEEILKDEKAAPKVTPPAPATVHFNPAPKVEAPAQPATSTNADSTDQINSETLHAAAKVPAAPHEGARISDTIETSSPRIDTSPAHVITLGENGAPKNLETAFNAMSNKHMGLKATDVTAESSAKSLNMAANLVELSKGHSVAGINPLKFTEAASFHDGILQIKDQHKLDELLSGLQKHAEENWHKGILQQNDAASHWVPKAPAIKDGDWLKEIHGNDHTMTHNANIADLHAGASESVDSSVGTESAPFNMSHAPVGTAVENAGVRPIAFDAEARLQSIKLEILRKMDGSASNVEPIHHLFPDLSREKNVLLDKILDKHPEFVQNPDHLSGEKLLEVYETSQKDLDFLFGNTVSHTWEGMRGLRASETLEHVTGLTNTNSAHDRLADYVRLLQSFTGNPKLEPRDSILYGGPETTEQYIARALQRVAANGKLEAFEEKMRESIKQ